MDVTPQVINEVEFHQKMRGYDPDEVDDFLERIALAVGQLQERIGEAEARAAAAERRAAEIETRAREVLKQQPAAPDLEEETETIRRTLLLAQKTADAAVREAEDEAQRVIGAAQEKASTLLSDAQTQARRVVSDAEVEARKTADETRQRIVNEIIALEETRDALKADQGILERHLDEQRLRLRSTIGDLQRLLDDPARLRAMNAPDLTTATRPSIVDDVLAEEREPAPEPAPAPVESPASAPAAEAVIDLDAVVPDAPVVERPVTGGVRFTPPEDTGDAPQAGGSDIRTAVATEDDDTDAWSRFVRQQMIDEPTAAVSVDTGDDAYLSELRKAMLDDTSAATMEPDERRARPRFGRRR